MAFRHVIRTIKNRRSVRIDDDDSDVVNIDSISNAEIDEYTSDVRSVDYNSNETSQLPLNACETVPELTPYDVVIRINSLTALKTSGWEIVLGNNAKNVLSPVSETGDGCGVIVAVLGSYNRGKSFLINQLCDINLESNNLIHTEGISMTAGRKQAAKIIFVDTAGTDTAIPKDQLGDKKATEALLKEIALQLCSHILIVVNRLRATDQSYIRQVITYCQSIHESKTIMIVHNLSDVETIDDMEGVINTEVKDLFAAKLDTMIFSGINVRFYSSKQENIEVRHFIFAKHGSQAAQSINQQSIIGIMNILQTATNNRRILDIVPEIIKYVNNRLPQIFNNSYEEDDGNSDENKSNKFQVEQHATKSCIVLSRRKQLENLDENPDEMELSPKLLYDDAGYFIGIIAAHSGQWTPRHSVYATSDEIHVIIELAGVKKGDLAVKKDAAQIEVHEEAVSIRGIRSDFKEMLINPTIFEEKIPTGQFVLEISLKDKVDPDNSRLELHDGLYKIICPKKKSKSKVF